jgi:hypothetical protein
MSKKSVRRSSPPSTNKPGPLEKLLTKSRGVLKHCEMCGANSSQLLEPGFKPDGKPAVLCQSCRIGSSELLADRACKEHKFVELVARMATQDEYQTDTEDTINILDKLIASARKITGIKPEPKDVTCPHCDGDGEEPGAPISTEEVAVCNLCLGSGVVTEKAAKKYREESEED